MKEKAQGADVEDTFLTHLEALGLHFDDEEH